MFKINATKEALKEGVTSKFINASGVYPVHINHVAVGVSKGGAEQFVFNINYNGNDQTIYGPYYKSKAGDYLEIATNLYSTLGVIVGMDDNADLTIEVEEHKIGKDNTPTDLDVVQEFSDVDVLLYVQQEFSEYNGIRENMVIRGFFNEEGLSAQEIISGEDAGKRLALVEEKYAINISYKDGLTAEDVAAWVANGRGKGTSAPVAKKAASKTKSLFGKK